MGWGGGRSSPELPPPQAVEITFPIEATHDIIDYSMGYYASIPVAAKGQIPFNVISMV